MKSIALAICVILFGACGSKKKAPDPAVDRYLNVDLAPHYAKLMAARAGYADLAAADVERPDNLAKLTHRLTGVALPFLTQALAGISAITPPAGRETFHADLIAVVTEEQAAIGDMSKALDPLDVDAFKRGHQRMMELQERRFSWERQLDGLIRDSAVKINPLPDVPIPEQGPTKPPEPVKAAGPPCAPGSEVKQGETLVECTTTEAIAGLCAAGKTTFHPTGAPKTCTTEMMFGPPETDPATPKDQMVLCGPGELVLDPAGVVLGCVAATDVMVAGTKVPKGSTLTLGPKATVVSARLPGGKTFKAP